MTSTSPTPQLDKFVQRLQQATDDKKRYEYLLWFAKRLPPFPASEKTPENKVAGCVSQVYITASLMDDKITFQGDSDALITKGLVGLLVEGLNGSSSETILQLKPDFIKQTGLNVSLTPSRANGFYNIFNTMKAKVYQLQN